MLSPLTAGGFPLPRVMLGNHRQHRDNSRHVPQLRRGQRLKPDATLRILGAVALLRHRRAAGHWAGPAMWSGLAGAG